MTRAAFDLLTNPTLMKNAKNEYIKQLRGRIYKKNPAIEAPLERARELAKNYVKN